MIKLIAVGKTVKQYLKEGEQEYDKRLDRYTKFEEVILPELKRASSLSVDEIKRKEGKLILEKIDPTDFVIVLDEKGRTLSSIDFAKWIDEKQIYGRSKLVFIIGGAYGFSSEVYDRAQYKLSLSKMTFSHQMIRMLFKEQLYRAFTIIKGEPYHHS
ncbi:23S rRNA (pseudouridine(1915)-N(3))-methyltransferase RlmH [Parvicella tangerina]|uniref:Ribosomal RNA large subunit methyltransferase H n=1 Tax=Parvicella tangerina TaxID=2829795 RepID=A0A916JNN9_9FLAO|nr:23S rRNA (pseudouridine(1915)-N(3))-methyltransferase RlmH [Parvicella tangerina]CAG5084277.1 Ribosomal RNA large subunit methyltransferase H [Parvicella tangerina]